MIALWVLMVALPFGLLTPQVQANGEYVLNEMASTRSGVAYSVHVIEDYAFITGNDGISVFDVSDASEPRRVSLLELADGAFDLFFDGWVAYIAADEEGLVVADFGNPEEPEIFGALNLDGSIVDVAVEGHLAYLADILNGLRIVDVSDVGAPVEVGSHRVSDLRAVKVRDGVAYLAVSNQGLTVLDVTEPSSPSAVRVVPGTYATIDLHLSVEYLYISCHRYGTKILNVSDPLNPEIVGEHTVSGGESYSAYDYGELLYIADLMKGARLLDISDPSTPQELASFGTRPHDVFHDGDYTYLACERGLVILQYGPPDSGISTNTSNYTLLLAVAAVVGVAIIVSYLRSRSP
jgi:hypothetical protein